MKANEVKNTGCDLLKNQYLCGINNSWGESNKHYALVVICSKINTFVVSTTVQFM